MPFFFSLLSLLSAFLLFQVQPVISKFILPWFGGSPGVWTTCMLFFQVVLFFGYAYAHGLSRFPFKTQWLVHSTLLLLALAFLPISPAESWKPSGGEEPSQRILWLLFATVGLPYFILSSTSPLTQVWFTRLQPGRAPWRLYALSNLGSLLALLSYPFFIEPLWDVDFQTKAWSIGFVAFVGLSLWLVRRSSQVASSAVAEEAGLAGGDAPRWWHRLLWLLLPAAASALLLAATNHVSQDVAVVPFMWVIPLSLYLLTFILCFEHERWYVRPLWAILAIVGVVGTALQKVIETKTSVDLAPNYLYDLAWCFGTVFVGCMVCHGELARLKPRSSRLTEFYLIMSAGGALGGLLVSQVAPQVFVTYLEWPLSLITLFSVASLLLVLLSWKLRSRTLRYAIGIALISHAVFGIYLLADQTLKVDDRLERVRNFYGAVNVDEEWDSGLESHYRTLTHGGIIHGMQNMGLQYREQAVTYYSHESGIGQALDHLEKRPDAHVGIVGMGAGTAACYASAGQRWRFYEINPEIPRLARKHFTFLSDAEKRGAQVDTILGDARLMLESEPAQKFDVLLLDAFSGDAIPVHLLTKEAFAIYQKHLKPDGILVVHVTNSYLALAPVVFRLAEEFGWKSTRTLTVEEGDFDSTDYIMLTNDTRFLESHPPDEPEDEEPKGIPLWTDRYHNLFQILMVN